jgi:hypothetical protein
MRSLHTAPNVTHTVTTLSGAAAARSTARLQRKLTGGFKPAGPSWKSPTPAQAGRLAGKAAWQFRLSRAPVEISGFIKE